MLFSHCGWMNSAVFFLSIWSNRFGGIMVKPLNCCSVRFKGFLMRVVFGYEFDFEVSFTCLISS